MITASIDYTHKDGIEVLENVIRVSLMTIDSSRIPAKELSLMFDTGAFITLIRKDRAELNGYKILEEKGCIISGFSEKGLICDLRKIPSAVFCGHRIDDVIIATPHDDGVLVSEVLGMNILENFMFGMDLDSREIYTKKRATFTSLKPKYQSGSVSLFRE